MDGVQAEFLIFRENTSLNVTNIGGSEYIGNVQLKYKIGEKYVRETISE